ncbi:MAG TPA: patatin-like phospholipase family protein [Frankiaceae bacterium]|nr:patatin-like phospholipase family protein [Frankiaceae bacterium]
MAEPRRGIVLGAGGVLGAAWTMGALSALADADAGVGFEGSSADVVVGTSAGSVLASFIARGVDTETLARHQRGTAEPGDPAVDYDYDAAGPLPPSPRWGTIGSRRLLAATARRPHRIPPAAALSAMLPVGRGSLEPIGKLVQGRDGTEPSWPTSPQLWIVATDFETGRRTVFGADGAPEATVSEAVMASCAIPAWYRPMVIGGRRYIDGGTCSATSADLLARQHLDEVYVLAPMASFELDCPSSALARIERQLRRATTRRLLREADKLRAVGTTVTMLAPGPEDLEAIGANMMDPRRRFEVFETSLRTSARSLREAGTPAKHQGLPAAG